MDKLAADTLPDGFATEWTTLAFQQIRAGNTAMFAFVLAVVFVFLVLAAQYESLTLPLAVIMIVPMCLVAAITGVILRGQDNNILTQVGFVVLIGLAAKNAILIVEFARQLEDQGRTRWEAAVEATRLRLRPILMTSFAFILGVTPLVWAIGAGAELRQALGTAVFSGMIGVTAFGLVFTPVFYVIARWIAELGLVGQVAADARPASGVSARFRVLRFRGGALVQDRLQFALHGRRLIGGQKLGNGHAPDQPQIRFAREQCVELDVLLHHIVLVIVRILDQRPLIARIVLIGAAAKDQVLQCSLLLRSTPAIRPPSDPGIMS